MTLQRPPEWTKQAACSGMVTAARDPWSPDDDAPRTVQAQETALARRICSTCPVRLSCAVEALEHAIPDGMWGGLTPADRRRVARRHGYRDPGAALHGSRSRYVAGCDEGPDGGACVDCRRAHARYERERRAARREQAATRVAPVWITAPDRRAGAHAGQGVLPGLHLLTGAAA